MAREAIEQAVTRGHADVLESRVRPHPIVAQQIAHELGQTADAPSGSPAQRAVVWSKSAGDAYLTAIQTLVAENPVAAKAAAGAIDRAVEALGEAPSGVAGRLPHTWEKAVPPFLLVFELVTWTKAGEVIAIDALVREAESR